MSTTRTFTDEEEAVLTRCLIACRPKVDDDDRKVIDGILRDGWVDLGAEYARRATKQVVLTDKDEDMIHELLHPQDEHDEYHDEDMDRGDR